VKKEFMIERDGRSFVLYAGLLDLAHERGLRGITTTLVQVPSDLNGMTAIVHATVETEQGTFTGIGDANPSNVTRMMAPHLLRMAETRAKARALRDAVNVGVTALEELADADETLPSGQSRDESDRRGQGARPAPAATRGSAGQGGQATPGARPAEPVPDEDEPEPERFPARTNGRAEGRPEHLRLGFGVSTQESRGGAGVAAPATPKQLQTIARMARAAGKTIETEGLSRAQASEIISGLIGEMGQLRAS
jgi:hypothetical protein